MLMSSDGWRLYASVPDTNEIMVIDTAKHRTVRTLALSLVPLLTLAVGPVYQVASKSRCNTTIVQTRRVTYLEGEMR